MTYKYFYQDKQNQNHESEIKARNREEAYKLLRRQGIRPYRMLGQDPWNWRPWAVSAGYLVLFVIIGILSLKLVEKEKEKESRYRISEDDALLFRLRAEEAVGNAPEVYRYSVWKGVNARLLERGLAPLPPPDGLVPPER